MDEILEWNKMHAGYIIGEAFQESRFPTVLNRLPG